MSNPCHVQAYQGAEPFLIVWSTPDDALQAATVCEKLSQDGYRCWYPEWEKQSTDLLNQKLFACVGMVAIYSQQAMMDHHFRKTITISLLNQKKIAAVILGQADLSFGMQIQLGKAPCVHYEESMLDAHFLTSDFKLARGKSNPGIQVQWRAFQDGELKIEQEPASNKAWVVSTLDENYEKELLRRLEERANKAKSTVEKRDDKLVILSTAEKKEKSTGEKKQQPVSDFSEPRSRSEQNRSQSAGSDLKVKPYDGKTILIESPQNDMPTVVIDRDMPILLIPSIGKIFSCANEATMIGRGSQCHVQLNDHSISSCHVMLCAEYFTQKSQYYLKDCNSTNGTWVNGTRLEKGAKWYVQGEAALIKLSRKTACLALFNDLAKYIGESVTILEIVCIDTRETNYLLYGELPLGRKYDWPLHSMDKPYISWKHAVINREEDEFVITDTHSTNGVFLNGQRLTDGSTTVLSSGDVVKLGIREFTISLILLRK